MFYLDYGFEFTFQLDGKEFSTFVAGEGKYWETTIGKMHDVSGIPFVLLVDGDSGEILATARELRGPGLSAFIGKQLAKKDGQAAVEKN